MGRLIDLLDLKERRIILSAGLFFIVVVLFHFSVVRSQVKALAHNQEALSAQKKELTNLKNSVTEKKKEYARWIEAEKDIEYVKENYFYHGKRSIREIRRDLDRLKTKTGIELGSLKYEYGENKNENVNKVSLSFDITGTYLLIKEFLLETEVLEKFLYVEKIRFENIEKRSGKLKVGISLAAYYVE